MSFTLPRASRRPWTRSHADAGGVLVLTAALFLPWLAGCSTPQGTLHPSYASLAPRSVSVLPVGNETLHQLEDVAFGGWLQRAAIGVERHNVPELLRGALEEALERKGYRTATAPDAKPAPAVLQATIERWESEVSGRFGMYMRYRLELRHVPSGEILYRGTFSCEERSDARSGSDDALVPTIRRSAARSLSALPDATQ